MSKYVGGDSYCDYAAGDGPSPTAHISWAKTGDETGRINGVTAALVTVKSVGGGVWASASGNRPTQAEADALGSTHEFVTSIILTPISLTVQHVYGGWVGGDAFTAYADAGTVHDQFGAEFIGSCDFTGREPFRDSTGKVQIKGGTRAVAVFSGYRQGFGEATVAGARHRLLYALWVLTDSTHALGLGGPEALPSS